MHNSNLIRDKVLKSWHNRDPLKKVKIIKTMSKQFKINNYNCSTNNYKIRRQQLWNQSSTNSSSRRSNHPHYLSSNHKAPIPLLLHWYLNRFSACKSRWRKGLGWCVTRLTWSREGLRMRRASSRCWRGSRAKTKTGKCNVILRNLSNLGDSLTLSINSNRTCVIRSWEWAHSQTINFCLNNNRWWEAVQLLINNTTREAIDKTDGYSKIHQTCSHQSTTINPSEMHVQKAQSKSPRPSNQSWLLCGQKF
jgi:hypothetical protein